MAQSLTPWAIRVVALAVFVCGALTVADHWPNPRFKFAPENAMAD